MVISESFSPDERIIVALDCDRARALELAQDLQGQATWLKVGMTLFYQEGPRIVEELKEKGFKVFLDLKFHDIPHQVAGAARAAALSGADMMTMHAIGGRDMMKAAVEGVTSVRDGAAVPVTLGITVLTSMSQADLEASGVHVDVRDQVASLAEQVKEAGLSGVVASPQEAAMLRGILGPEAYIVTPGVRPSGSSLDDQNRVATPKQAFEAGASHIVIGRPITASDDPRAAFKDIVKGLL